MYNVVILYAPAEKNLKQIAQNVQKCFDKKVFKVRILTASKAIIPDVAAADLIILGSRSDDKVLIHNDFSELIRAFSGINLAGRVACFIVTKQSKSHEEFIKVLTDSNITFHEEPLYIFDGKNINKKNISTWVKNISKTFKEMINERKF